MITIEKFKSIRQKRKDSNNTVLVDSVVTNYLKSQRFKSTILIFTLKFLGLIMFFGWGVCL